MIDCDASKVAPLVFAYVMGDQHTIQFLHLGCQETTSFIGHTVQLVLNRNLSVDGEQTIAEKLALAHE